MTNNRMLEFEQLIYGVLRFTHIWSSAPHREDLIQICYERIWCQLLLNPDLSANNNRYLFQILCNAIHDYNRKLKVRSENENNQPILENQFTDDPSMLCHLHLTLLDIKQTTSHPILQALIDDLIAFPDARINERSRRLNRSRQTIHRQRLLLQQLISIAERDSEH
ncbi:hypothetical protein H9L19_02540 [Weissella diestrammenae]|uniref:Uncharacterized protein n=1 Tax=Weissella diestrammenae TaxID=1162633 RepID=A0A7G9T6N5_9LACO|nr:hypothetical protein [Weissella diestrammenae]MCM0582955.1 hypothetical protein [Weissella diestrammenae]QNN75760.1 hypothetical protein H9L19_02540 [Weissella diestrammenae]